MAIPQELLDKLSENGIIAVLEIDSEQNAVPLAKALLDSGITVIELTLRTPAAIPSIKLIAKEVPQICIGVGTIIKPGQASEASAINGVKFGVSPGINPEIVKEAASADLPFIPGIATPSELELALSLGYSTVKFFPAESLGGLKYLKNINAPYNHLNIKYIPLGGVTTDNLCEYANYKPVLAVGGSWIANKELIAAQNWKEIAKRAREAKEIWNQNKG